MQDPNHLQDAVAKISQLTQTIKIYRHKKLLRVGNFTIKFNKDKK